VKRQTGSACRTSNHLGAQLWRHRKKKEKRGRRGVDLIAQRTPRRVYARGKKEEETLAPVEHLLLPTGKGKKGGKEEEHARQLRVYGILFYHVDIGLRKERGRGGKTEESENFGRVAVTRKKGGGKEDNPKMAAGGSSSRNDVVVAPRGRGGKRGTAIPSPLLSSMAATVFFRGRRREGRKGAFALF